MKVETVASVRSSAARVSAARSVTLAAVFDDVDAARTAAAAAKKHVLANLKPLLLEFEENLIKNGVKVHWALDAGSACKQISAICSSAAPNGALIVKAKSMATEEIHLNKSLIEDGHTPIETDLGEFIIQLDQDTPSHVVQPIIHKNRRNIAESFREHGLGPYTEDPEELTMQARAHLREKFRKADVGISGVNFGIAETGRIVLVENEGNNRLSTTAPKVHIAVMGIEKLLAFESDLPLFLRLLAGSATGQRLTVYTHFITGPRREALDGPQEVHVVLLDNGRSGILEGRYRDILGCIRCGACLNVCPVYRAATGHAYRHVYPGPVGAVLAPALEGVDSMGDLAFASTLCGACKSVCPVDIDIPSMLLHLRAEQRANKWRLYAKSVTSAKAWRRTLRMLPLATKLPNPWKEFRDTPARGKSFRRWWNERS
ncbi:MAG: lactate utilization protein [Armatimonadetes bacterium]|nr:lactate utilization protein [Armatimonadota bacterium]